jgi:5-methylcytosine-specific restriction enzyme A
MRQEFSRKVKRERLDYVKAKNPEHPFGRCEGCGVVLQRGRYHADHHLPDWMGGKPTFENCRILCVVCHEVKTSEEATVRAKSNRIRDKWNGVMQARTKIHSRGFPETEPQRTASRPLKKPLPERRMS